MTSRRVIIALKGLGALANHGVYDFERTQEQRFSADVVMWVETAGTTDDITATVSYADIADETMAILTGNPVDVWWQYYRQYCTIFRWRCICV